MKHFLCGEILNSFVGTQLFLLSVVLSCVFQGTCPFDLYYLMCWHEVVIIAPYYFFTVYRTSQEIIILAGIISPDHQEEDAVS